MRRLRIACLTALAAMLITMGCAAVGLSASATAPATRLPGAPPSSTPPAIIPSTTATLLPSATPTPGEQAYDYKVVYQDGSFSIREAFLGTDAIWKDGFQMPAGRIKDSVQSLGMGRDMACETGAQGNGPCTQTVKLAMPGGTSEDYIFRLDSLQGGTGILIKNGRLLWSGVTNGAGSFAILASRRIGDELAFEYTKSNAGSGEANTWVAHAILLTRGNSVLLLPNAFAPNPIGDKLMYFRVKTRQEIIVFDGKEVGQPYDAVFNQPCCWGGPPIQMAADGQVVDFFAQRGRDWYHVQAGYLAGTK